MTRFLAAWCLLSASLLGAGCFSTRQPRARMDQEIALRQTAVDYAPWAATLARYVDDAGQVDYARLAQEPANLERFVGQLAALGPRTRPELFPTRAARLAYYLNAYNAFVLANVLDRWPLTSVADDKADFFYFTRFPLDGKPISLYDLENDVVRAQFREPRVHFALNCASRGCPRLPREPFDPDRLDEQLARETRRFLHEERNVARVEDELVLSEIFDWFAEDFPPSPLEWIRTQAPDLDLPAEPRLTFRKWDWALNRP